MPNYIRVTEGLPGCGKTSKLLDEVATIIARYLYVVSRIELIQERIKDLNRRLAKTMRTPTLREVHSESGCKLTVRQEIEDIAELHQHEDHCIIFITHEGMMASDLKGFDGWHIVIDECPAAVWSGSPKVSATSYALAAFYDLVPSDHPGWFRVNPKATEAGHRAFLKDENLKGFAEFDKRVRSPQGVYVDIDDWKELQGSMKHLNWWSLWSPRALKAFESVTIAGAGYFHSLGYKLAMKLFPDELIFKRDLIVSQDRACPRLRLHYFTKHRGSTTFWKTKKGKECLVEIAKWLSQMPVPVGFWATNKDFQDLFRLALMKSQHVSPRQEGTNGLVHYLSCLMLYSAKANPSDTPLLMLGLTRAEIKRAREDEDIIQFAHRGAARNPDFGGDYDIYLYSLDQAEALATYLTEMGVGTVELVPVDEAGIMDVTREQPGRKAETLDERSLAQWEKEKREKDRERKQLKRAKEREQKKLDGTYRPRGRTKKVVALLPAPDLQAVGSA